MSKPRTIPSRATATAALTARRARAMRTRPAQDRMPQRRVVSSEPSTLRPASPLAGDAQHSVPRGDGEDRIVLRIQDPWCLYAYWEIQPETERACQRHLLPEEVLGLQSILRVSDVTDRTFPAHGAHRSFDIGLSGLARSWYIRTDDPGRECVVEIGFLTNTGRFLPLARSNRVRTPPAEPSTAVDEAWPLTEQAFRVLVGAQGGARRRQRASRAALPRPLGSGSWSALQLLGPPRPPASGRLWVRVETDLVIHGATEPNAKVAIHGQPVAVQRDGTFSLRLALPEGTHTINVEVTLPDGQQTTAVCPVVTRGTKTSVLPRGAVSARSPRGAASGPP